MSEIYSIGIFNNKEEISIKKITERKKQTLIIPLNKLGKNQIIDEYIDDIELSPIYNTEKINLLNEDNSCNKQTKNRNEKNCGNIHDEIYGIKKPLDDFGDIFQDEKDIYVFNETNADKNNILKEENDEISEKEKFSDKDCVEYELKDNQDYIICTRYE